MEYEYDIVIGNEYVVSSATDLELKHEEPFYTTDGKMSLVMYPSKEVVDYLEENETPAFAVSYAEAFVTFEEEGTKMVPTLFICSNDLNGDIYDKEFSLSKESCEILQEVVEKQVNRVGFKTFADLQEDFKKFLGEVQDVVKEEVKTEAKETSAKVSLRPAQKQNDKGLSEERE